MNAFKAGKPQGNTHRKYKGDSMKQKKLRPALAAISAQGVAGSPFVDWELHAA